ncbi:hypothetical protein [Kineococcus sp. NPDC059986]|uniref:hypothetical protein n=1 Tax=Kineococcus sp. NPDC059986 TaxID=3155538 RepID=UPI00344EBEAC
MEGEPFSRRDPGARARTVRSEVAARFLSTPGSLRYFAPFLARETTAGQVARDLGVDIGSVTYRIRRMLDLDLLAHTRTTPRAGRPVRHYRSVADAVFVPLVLTTAESLAEVFRSSRADAADDLAAAAQHAWLQLGAEAGWGTHLYRTRGGAVNRDFVPRGLLDSDGFWPQVLADRSPAVWDQYAELHLDRTRAKALQRELADLVRRYAEPVPGQDESGSPHLVHLAMAPRR